MFELEVHCLSPKFTTAFKNKKGGGHFSIHNKSKIQVKKDGFTQISRERLELKLTKDLRL